MDWAMLGLFHPFDLLVKIFFENRVYLPFVERNISKDQDFRILLL
jgi:hypothetical protein